MNKLVRVIRKVSFTHVIPSLATFSVLYLTLALVSHLSFKFFDAAGLYCEESPADDRYLIPGEERVRNFRIDSLCQPTGVVVQEGQSYDITIKQLTPWRKQLTPLRDGLQQASLRGFSASDVNPYSTRVLYIVGTPLRRILTRPWLRMILRVGRVGAYEEFVDPDEASQGTSERLRFRSSGELFLYINDAVLSVPVPSLAGMFYKYNSGTAEVRIRKVKLDSAPP